MMMMNKDIELIYKNKTFFHNILFPVELIFAP